MAKPKTVTPPPPSSGQDYIEMDRIPPRRGNPKEAQRTVAIVGGALIVLAVGVSLRETIYKPRFTTTPLPQSTVTDASSKETVTDIPTGFTRSPLPIRARTSGAKANRSGGAPVPSPFGTRGATSAPNTGTASDSDAAAVSATTGGGSYDPLGAVRSAASQPTVSLTPRNNDADTSTASTGSPYNPSTAPPQTGSGYTPAYGTSSLRTSGSNTGTSTVGGGMSNSYGAGTGSVGSGLGTSTGGTYGSGSYGRSGSGNGASGGGIYSSPYSSPYGGTGTSSTGTGSSSGAPR